MIQVPIIGLSTSEIIEIVHELRNDNLMQGKDFDFTFYPASWDGFNLATHRHAVFTFHKESLASWFILKYGSGYIGETDDV